MRTTKRTSSEGYRAPGELEAQVMAVLHSSEDALTPAETMSALHTGLSYSTVVTTLTRLYSKGLLTRTPRGRAFAYQPVSDESGLVAMQMANVLNGRSDRAAVLKRFVSNLSADDERMLRSFLDEDSGRGQ